MKNKITKKRTDIVETLLAELVPHKIFGEDSKYDMFVVKNSFYHNRLYIAVREKEKQIAHIILSRKKDYILKVVITPTVSSCIDTKYIHKYFQKNFPCKAGKFIVSQSDIAYSEQHPNDIIEHRSLN